MARKLLLRPKSSAVYGGNITSDGGSSVTEGCLCWTITANPTTSNNKTSIGNGSGAFTSYISDLAPGIIYHVRVYATNSVGTAYGVDVAF